MAEKKLNKEQLQAIRHGEGPLLIIAGAGTGKTTVITERIRHLITNGFAKPEEILALTFTEKAATEMEQRVDEVMPLSYGDVWIMTFHSFCDQVLRLEGLHVGLPTNFKLMTKEKSIDLFKRNLFDFSLNYFRPLGNPNKFIDSILTHFSRLQDEVVTPQEYLNWVNKKEKENTDNSEETLLEIKKWKELATIYKEYDELKLKTAKFDFGDLVIKTIDLFKNRPNILKKYQEKFKYILVDEYQDTNYGQNELVNLIVKKENLPAGRQENITVVGDDNQSIYAFRGAAINNILKFKKTYPEATTVTLNTNYRSTQNILDNAYRLIKHNDPDTLEARMGINKKLISIKGKGEDVKFSNLNSNNEEAEMVADEIIKLVNTRKNNFNYSDIAILVRANNHAESFVREFERKGIPHQFLGPSKLFEREEITDLISYLKSLYDPEDSESFYRFISSKIFAFEASDLLKVVGSARRNSKSIYEVIAENKTYDKALNIYKKHLVQTTSKLAGEILYEYLVESGIYEKMIENEEDIKAKNISIFFQKVKSFENENPNALLPQAVDYINLVLEVGDSPLVNEGNWQENNSVNILTLHSSKGLEFPIVFLVNLVSDRFPSRNRSEDLPIPDELIKEELPQGDFHLQEERRLMYVGMTRAKERLYLTAAKFYGDGKREKKVSIFVTESLGEVVNYQLPTIKFNQISDHKLHIKNNDKSKKQKIKIDYLSVSQIETFETCPMHYLLKYVYNIPTQKTASMSFGNSIHETLKRFVENPKQDVLNLYKELFQEEGYLNKKHKQEFYKLGEKYLLEFLEKEKQSLSLRGKTISLEEKFNIKINDSLKIGGKIDRVDDLGQGRYEIIDYKTGEKIPTQKEVDKNMQLSFYALAVSTLYNVKPEDIVLSLYYFDKQVKISTRRTMEDLENLKKEILEIRDEIVNSDFKCNSSYFCQQGCEFPMFCKSDN